MTQLTNDQKVDLEAMIDTHGLHKVLDALADICNEKADHVRANWQDKGLALSWERCAKAIDKARVPATELP